MNKKFKNADELVEYCIQNNILTGQIWVESNPRGEGKRTLLYFHVHKYFVDTYFINTHHGNQDLIYGVSYSFSFPWHTVYEGSFELIEPAEVTQKWYMYNKSQGEVSTMNLKTGEVTKSFGVTQEADSVKSSNKTAEFKVMGFDPENLTYNGVKIKAGDQAEIWGYGRFEIEWDTEIEELCVNWGCRDPENSYYLPLNMLNITAHIPATDEEPELERLEEELSNAEEWLIDTLDNPKRSLDTDKAALDRYYQARKNVESYKRKNM